MASNTGERTSFKIFGSPLSPASGRWAFGYSAERVTTVWDDIPLDTDILVTHTPPKYHCDMKRGNAVGCEALLHALRRVRPRLAICGHVHEGRGVEIIDWNASTPDSGLEDIGVYRWRDPGKDNKKTSLVDLTGTHDRSRSANQFERRVSFAACNGISHEIPEPAPSLLDTLSDQNPGITSELGVEVSPREFLCYFTMFLTKLLGSRVAPFLLPEPYLQ